MEPRTTSMSLFLLSMIGYCDFDKIVSRAERECSLQEAFSLQQHMDDIHKVITACTDVSLLLKNFESEYFSIIMVY